LPEELEISHFLAREVAVNGVAERFMRTLREQCLYVHRFQNIEEARAVIGAFIERYNEEWLLQRHSYRTRNQVRAAAAGLPRAA